MRRARRSITALALLAGLGGAALWRALPGGVATIVVALPGTPASVLALDPVSGRGFVPLDPPIWSGFVPPTGRAGLQAALVDVRSRRLLRSVDAGTTILALASDSGSRRLYLLDTAGGGSIPWIDMATGLRGGSLTAGPGIPLAMVVDARAGHLLVQMDAGGAFRTLTFDSHSGRILAVRADSRPEDFWNPVVDEATHRAFFSVSGLVGAIYSIGAVRVLDTRTGRPVATTRLSGAVSALAIDPLAGKVAAVAGTTLTLLDSSTGLPARTASVPPGTALLTMDPRTGHTFVVGGDGQLTIIDTRSGAVLAHARVGAVPRAIAVDRPRHHVLVVVADYVRRTAVLQVLDSRTGRPRRSLPIPLFPRAIGIDEVTGKVLIAGIVIERRDPWAWLPDWARHLPLFPAAPPPRDGSGAIIILDPG